MKTMIMMIIAAGVISAQTIYKVAPGSMGNKILLAVENSLDQNEMTGIKVALVKTAEVLRFRETLQNIPKLEKQNSREVEFIFDVERIVNADKTDTLKFEISSTAGIWTKEILISYELPSEFRLEQNFPNPFNPFTTIQYSVPTSSSIDVETLYPAIAGQVATSLRKIILKIYDILGREVKTLVNEFQQPGNYEIKFDASNLPSGVYFYSLSDGTVRLVKKMLVLK